MEQMQMLDYQIKQMQKVLETIDAQVFEINKTVESLQEFSALSNKEEILFPLANGIFARGTLTDNRMLRINIGSDVVVDKTVKETTEMMQKQSLEIENYKKEVMEQLQKFLVKMQELQG